MPHWLSNSINLCLMLVIAACVGLSWSRLFRVRWSRISAVYDGLVGFRECCSYGSVF